MVSTHMNWERLDAYQQHISPLQRFIGNWTLFHSDLNGLVSRRTPLRQFRDLLSTFGVHGSEPGEEPTKPFTYLQLDAPKREVKLE